ncbi:MAG: hypothetical protein AB7P03_27270 [Kofleriaceae bacterium]
MTRPVNGARVALAAALLAFVYVVVAFVAYTVPDRLIAMLGGPTGVERFGGLEVHYQPPASADLPAFERQLARDGATIVHRDGAFVLEFRGLARDAAQDTLEILQRGGMHVHEVLLTSYAKDIGPSDGVSLEEDAFQQERGTYYDQFLAAPTRELLERAIAAARSRGWHPPRDSSVQLELEQTLDGPRWRTYLLANHVILDGMMVAEATVGYDRNTNHPAVMVDLTREATPRFGDATERLVGKRLAIVVGDRVVSAPTVNEPIREGRLWISMGRGTSILRSEQEAAALVRILSYGLPAGGTIVSKSWHEPGGSAYEWVSRGLLGLIAGVLFGGIVFAVIRITRPHWRAPAFRPAGRFPVRRLAVTLLGPVVVLIGSKIPLPLSVFPRDEWEHGVTSAEAIPSVIHLGLVPVIGAFVLVELVALANPAWGHNPRTRITMGQITAGVAIVLTLLQAHWFAETLLRAANDADLSVDVNPLTVTATLGAGTMLLTIIAGVIREHGLGNGYGIILISVIVVNLVGAPESDAVLPTSRDAGSTDPASGMTALVLIGVIAHGLITSCVLRWRVTDPSKPGLRVPSSGIAPLLPLGGLALVAIILGPLGVSDAFFELLEWCLVHQLDISIQLIATLVAALVYAWLFARPSLLATTASGAGVQPPTWATWARSVLISGVMVVPLIAVGLVSRSHQYTFLLSPTVPIAIAVVIDILDDARAHRAKLAAVHVLHQIQRAAIVEHVLAARSIPCHIHAGNLRTLLAFFGPWAPAVVLVPEQHASEARAALAASGLDKVFD